MNVMPADTAIKATVVRRFISVAIVANNSAVEKVAVESRIAARRGVQPRLIRYFQSTISGPYSRWRTHGLFTCYRGGYSTWLTGMSTVVSPPNGVSPVWIIYCSKLRTVSMHAGHAEGNWLTNCNWLQPSHRYWDSSYPIRTKWRITRSYNQRFGKWLLL